MQEKFKMKINKLYLKNIRSYKEAEIEMPSSSVLLCGDIGSGKTTILLAIEFALFGLQKGILSGASLLRHGSSTGIARLDFEVGGKHVVIERTLKRTAKGIVQDKGSITIQGKHESLSAEELKQRVLELLAYPAEFLKKTNMLYRYTVYTPQEEMRAILQESPEERIDTLRKIFGVDKYKRIKENSAILSRVLRESIKNKQSLVTDIEEKKATLAQKESSKADIAKKISIATTKLASVKTSLESCKIELKKSEEQAEKLRVLSSEIERKRAELSATKEHKEELQQNRLELVEIIEKAKKTIKTIKPDLLKKEFEQKLEQKKFELENLRKALLIIDKKLGGLEQELEEKKELIKKISTFEKCPLCRQAVTKVHRKELLAEIKTELKEKSNMLEQERSKRDRTEKAIELAKKALEKLQVEQLEAEKMELQLQNIKEKESELKRIDAMILRYIEKEDDIAKELEKLVLHYKDNEKITEKIKKLKEEFELLMQEERKLAVAKAQLDGEAKLLEETICTLRKELATKEAIKKDIMQLSELREWLDNAFLATIEAIEKTVLSKLHHDFSELFRKWFGMLVTDMDSRIDENFTPIIESQGYELDYSYLSGGERTAAALAYRLALNHVINSLMTKLKTNDLLILDEPTDGFSSAQIEKLRDVLSELAVKQLILVSHETEVEDFVEHVIHFRKEQGTTKIS